MMATRRLDDDAMKFATDFDSRNIKLVFFDSWSYSTEQYRCESIRLRFPVKVHRMEIVGKGVKCNKPDIHFNEGQTEPDCFSAELFARSYGTTTNEVILISNLNYNGQAQGAACNYTVITDFVMIKGKFKGLTLLLYGEQCQLNGRPLKGDPEDKKFEVSAQLSMNEQIQRVQNLLREKTKKKEEKKLEKPEVIDKDNTEQNEFVEQKIFNPNIRLHFLPDMNDSGEVCSLSVLKELPARLCFLRALFTECNFKAMKNTVKALTFPSINIQDRDDVYTSLKKCSEPIIRFAHVVFMQKHAASMKEASETPQSSGSVLKAAEEFGSYFSSYLSLTLRTQQLDFVSEVYSGTTPLVEALMIIANYCNLPEIIKEFQPLRAAPTAVEAPQASTCSILLFEAVMQIIFKLHQYPACIALMKKGELPLTSFLKLEQKTAFDGKTVQNLLSVNDSGCPVVHPAPSVLSKELLDECLSIQSLCSTCLEFKSAASTLRADNTGEIVAVMQHLNQLTKLLTQFNVLLPISDEAQYCKAILEYELLGNPEKFRVSFDKKYQRFDSFNFFEILNDSSLYSSVFKVIHVVGQQCRQPCSLIDEGIPLIELFSSVILFLLRLLDSRQGLLLFCHYLSVSPGELQSIVEFCAQGNTEAAKDTVVKSLELLNTTSLLETVREKIDIYLNTKAVNKLRHGVLKEHERSSLVNELLLIVLLVVRANAEVVNLCCKVEESDEGGQEIDLDSMKKLYEYSYKCDFTRSIVAKFLSFTEIMGIFKNVLEDSIDIFSSSRRLIIDILLQTVNSDYGLLISYSHGRNWLREHCNSSIKEIVECNTKNPLQLKYLSSFKELLLQLRAWLDPCHRFATAGMDQLLKYLHAQIIDLKQLAKQLQQTTNQAHQLCSLISIRIINSLRLLQVLTNNIIAFSRLLYTFGVTDDRETTITNCVIELFSIIGTILLRPMTRGNQTIQQNSIWYSIYTNDIIVMSVVTSVVRLLRAILLRIRSGNEQYNEYHYNKLDYLMFNKTVVTHLINIYVNVLYRNTNHEFVKLCKEIQQLFLLYYSITPCVITPNLLYFGAGAMKAVSTLTSCFLSELQEGGVHKLYGILNLVVCMVQEYNRLNILHVFKGHKEQSSGQECTEGSHCSSLPPAPVPSANENENDDTISVRSLSDPETGERPWKRPKTTSETQAVFVTPSVPSCPLSYDHSNILCNMEELIMGLCHFATQTHRPGPLSAKYVMGLLDPCAGAAIQNAKSKEINQKIRDQVRKKSEDNRVAVKNPDEPALLSTLYNNCAQNK